jgi:hypothetical protein
MLPGAGATLKYLNKIGFGLSRTFFRYFEKTKKKTFPLTLNLNLLK